MGKIFQRERLKASQLRTVAQRRLDDAEWLRKSGDNNRANGVFYLGGFVIECLLKAKMLERYPSMRRAPSPDRMSEQDRRIWYLIYRSHDLDGMLGCLPDLETELVAADRRDGTRRWTTLKSICRSWTIFARYSPRMETMKDAEDFLDDVRELKQWLNR